MKVVGELLVKPVMVDKQTQTDPIPPTEDDKKDPPEMFSNGGFGATVHRKTITTIPHDAVINFLGDDDDTDFEVKPKPVKKPKKPKKVVKKGESPRSTHIDDIDPDIDPDEEPEPEPVKPKKKPKAKPKLKQTDSDVEEEKQPAVKLHKVNRSWHDYRALATTFPEVIPLIGKERRDKISELYAQDCIDRGVRPPMSWIKKQRELSTRNEAKQQFEAQYRAAPADNAIRVVSN